MSGDVLWGIGFTLAVLGALGAWFRGCGRADRRRQARPFAKATLRYAGSGFVVGVALLTSDLGGAAPEGRMGLIAFTVCCFLLVYAALSAIAASNDDSLVVVNLTGHALLLADPTLAPFYTLPAPQDEAATELPPVRPRTCYVVSAELGRLGAQAGRTDLFTADLDPAVAGTAGPVRIRRLIPAVPTRSRA